MAAMVSGNSAEYRKGTSLIEIYLLVGKTDNRLWRIQRQVQKSKGDRSYSLQEVPLEGLSEEVRFENRGSWPGVSGGEAFQVRE